MPEILRSLIVVFFISFVVFRFGKNAFIALGVDKTQIELRQKTWLAITATGFLAFNFWIFCLVITGLILYAKKRDSNKVALLAALLFAAPLFPAEISGFGIINYFITINYFRLLSIFLLLPAYLHLRKQKDTHPFGKSLADIFLLGYLIVGLVLQAQLDTATNVLRTCFYHFVDIFLPYYVVSRGLKETSAIKEFCASFVMGATPLAVIGFFEFVKHWLLYSQLDNMLGVSWGLGNYLPRDGFVRAIASFGHPIVMGYVMSISIGLYLFVNSDIVNRTHRRLLGGALVLGLIAPLSRGPWIGAAALIAIFIVLGPNPVKSTIKSIALGTVITLALLITPYHDRVIDLLPFIGTVETNNIDFRQKLFDNSMIVIARNPLFGSFDAMLSPEMEELRAQGIIDVVNSYISITLSGGLVSLSLFLGFFLSALFGLFFLPFGRKLNDTDMLMRRVLIASIISAMITIATVSSILMVPILYWILGGLAVAAINSSKSNAKTNVIRAYPAPKRNVIQSI
jgi:hypothetical protein